MSEDLIKKEKNFHTEDYSEQILKKMYLKEMIKKLQEKIESNDPVFMKALKYYLSDVKDSEKIQ